MSSPTLSIGLPDSTSAAGGAPGDGGGGMQRGASYFFGFLITFVALLLIFVGCGVVSRRRFSARQRARFEWDMEPWRNEDGYASPVLLEKDFVNAKSESRWKDLIPLAALVVSPHHQKRPSDAGKDPPTSRPPPASSQTPYSPPGGGRDIENLEVISRTLSAASQRRSESQSLARISSGQSGLVRITSPTPYHRNPNVIRAQQEVEQNWRRQQDEAQESVPRRWRWLRYLNPMSWFMFLFRRRREQGASGDVEQGAQGSDYHEKPQEDGNVQKDKMLQIAILIEMPSRTPHASGDSEHLPAYEIGVVHIPWTDELRGHWSSQLAQDDLRSSSSPP